MTTQARLMREFAMTEEPATVRRVVSGPSVAPKPKFNPLSNRTAKPFRPDYQADEDLPPPPPPVPSGYGEPQEHFPPPPPPAPAAYQSTKPAFYQESSRPTHTVTSRPMQNPSSTSGPMAEQVSSHYSANPMSGHVATGYSAMPAPFSYKSVSAQPQSMYAPPTENSQPVSQVRSAIYQQDLHDQFPDVPPPPQSHVPKPTDQPIRSPVKTGKEAEVDALTSMLVQSLDASSEPGFYGMCAKCEEKIADNSGCSAMDKTFHVTCFTCTTCRTSLTGKQFYVMETEPYCEQCYMNTLERCSVCMKPITERILRATGKPYHPSCFTCVVCRKSLDGIPFTVDAASQIHCIEDFHRKFAPRCCVCELPIMPDQGLEETIRIVAMDRSFHVGCYKCEDCGLVLSSEAEGRGCYPLDDHILCKNCNAHRIQSLTSKMTTEL